LLRLMRPASSRTLRCREMAGWDIGNGAATSRTARSPSASRARIARRVGSASAPNTVLSRSTSITMVSITSCLCKTPVIEHRVGLAVKPPNSAQFATLRACANRRTVNGLDLDVAPDHRAGMATRGGSRRVSEKEAERLGKGSAAELLSAWRGAERDRVAAEETLQVASVAALAAAEAARAAQETSEAARLTMEAAQKAELAARRTSEAAELLAKSAGSDKGAATE